MKNLQKLNVYSSQLSSIWEKFCADMYDDVPLEEQHIWGYLPKPYNRDEIKKVQYMGLSVLRVEIYDGKRYLNGIFDKGVLILSSFDKNIHILSLLYGGNIDILSAQKLIGIQNKTLSEIHVPLMCDNEAIVQPIIIHSMGDDTPNAPTFIKYENGDIFHQIGWGKEFLEQIKNNA